MEQRVCLHAGVTVYKPDDIGKPFLILVKRKRRVASPVDLCHGTELGSDSSVRCSGRNLQAQLP